MWVQSLGGEDPLEEEMATHSSILAWRIPRTEETGGYGSCGHGESDMPERLSMRTLESAQGDPLEKGMAIHSSILAWRIPRTEEPGGLQSAGSQRIRHN